MMGFCSWPNLTNIGTIALDGELDQLTARIRARMSKRFAVITALLAAITVLGLAPAQATPFADISGDEVDAQALQWVQIDIGIDTPAGVTLRIAHADTPELLVYEETASVDAEHTFEWRGATWRSACAGSTTHATLCSRLQWVA